MDIRVENWNGHKIRFVERSIGDWWAVLADVTNAMGLIAKKVKQRLPEEVLSKHHLQTSGGIQEMLIVNEYGIYETVFESRKKEAKEFKRWVYEMIKHLRQATGLEAFQVFRMLDKDHQKEAMSKLRSSLQHPVRVDFIKANTIANKTVSSMFGYPKMVKKEVMTPDMLVRRQQVLDDTVNLMSVTEKFGLDLSVSEKVYGKYLQ
ncbi:MULTISPECIES: BRO-N domain-containing protein [Paenibacillus]|uniref:BRO family protein n=1 Tax=Paenibacillus ehimensis TaxID=79264 RepID=A0ABT8VI53_9BACL|nr:MULTISPECIES: BRO family protein [Paenibacillus]MBU7319035.1 phage repressor protein [Paenibacillus oleatilyticus]MDO3680669.1 BRO family protein [Paenibacillus ehimensis]